MPVITTNYETEKTVGDTRKPISGYLVSYEGDVKTPIELDGLVVEFKMESTTGTAKVAQTSSNVTIQPTLNFTANPTTDKIKAVAHNLSKGMMLQLSNSGGALPGGLEATERYFIIDTEPDYFKLSASPNGAKIDITGEGTGTHSFYVVGHVQYQWQSADVDTAGVYRCWFIVKDSGKPEHFPTRDNEGDGQGNGIKVTFVLA